MLNLDPKSVMTLSAEEKAHIKSVDNSWDANDAKTKIIKNRISRKTLKDQSCRCAYCERLLELGGVHIDHIADKARYSNFTFVPLNLVSSCSFCNSGSNKGKCDTIAKKDTNYDKCDFVIVHPYLDHPENHIRYLDGTDRIIFDKENCTPKGIETINIFNWESCSARLNRMALAKLRDFDCEEYLVELIAEICTYKPK